MANLQRIEKTTASTAQPGAVNLYPVSNTTYRMPRPLPPVFDAAAVSDLLENTARGIDRISNALNTLDQEVDEVGFQKFGALMDMGVKEADGVMLGRAPTADLQQEIPMMAENFQSSMLKELEGIPLSKRGRLLAEAKVKAEAIRLKSHLDYSFKRNQVDYIAKEKFNFFNQAITSGDVEATRKSYADLMKFGIVPGMAESEAVSGAAKNKLIASFSTLSPDQLDEEIARLDGAVADGKGLELDDNRNKLLPTDLRAARNEALGMKNFVNRRNFENMLKRQNQGETWTAADLLKMQQGGAIDGSTCTSFIRDEQGKNFNAMRYSMENAFLQAGTDVKAELQRISAEAEQLHKSGDLSIEQFGAIKNSLLSGNIAAVRQEQETAKAVFEKNKQNLVESVYFGRGDYSIMESAIINDKSMTPSQKRTLIETLQKEEKSDGILAGNGDYQLAKEEITALHQNNQLKSGKWFADDYKTTDYSRRMLGELARLSKKYFIANPGATIEDFRPVMQDAVNKIQQTRLHSLYGSSAAISSDISDFESNYWQMKAGKPKSELKKLFDSSQIKEDQYKGRFSVPKQTRIQGLVERGDLDIQNIESVGTDDLGRKIMVLKDGKKVFVGDYDFSNYPELMKKGIK